MTICSITDGTTPNSADCKCGTSTCDSTSGLMCDSTTSTCSPGDCGGDIVSKITQQNCDTFNPRCQCVQCKKGFYTNDCSKKCPEPAVAIFSDITLAILAVWVTLAYLYFQNIEDQTNGAHIKLRASTKKQGLRILQGIIAARMQVLSAIFASITWSLEIPIFLVDLLNFLCGFFTFDVPGLLSSPDCLYVYDKLVGNSTTTGAMVPLDKWYISLLLLFGLVLLVALPTYCYRWKHVEDKDDKDYERMANGWNNVCTQLSVVWIFAAVISTSLAIVDCDNGTEGGLIMDPSLPCPLSSEATPYDQDNLPGTLYDKDGQLIVYKYKSDPDPGPAVLGICMLVIYFFGILGFLGIALGETSQHEDDIDSAFTWLTIGYR